MEHKMMDIGLSYIDNFISKDEHSSLINEILFYREQNPKSIAGYGNNNYDSIYFGERYNKTPQKFPGFLNEICDKLITQKILEEYPFGIAINQYQKGQKIGAHIDKPISGPIVTILSLGCESTIIFKKKDREDIVQVLAPTSLVQIKNEIRNEWTHEILPVKDLRYSIIFRSNK